MARTTHLWRSDELSVHRLDHPADHEDRPYKQIAPAYAASFVEDGAFDLYASGDFWRLGRGDVFLRRPGLVYEAGYEHERFTDTCLTVTYLSAEQDGFDRAHGWTQQRPMLRASNRLLYLRWALAHAVAHNQPMLIEHCASEIFRTEEDAPQVLFRERKLAWYAERVHAACERMNAAFDQEHTISAFAREAGMSVFQFTRVFAALIGAPPHRYLNDARLRAAASMLADGRSVTDACFACGYNNLSHFSRAFTRRYGVSPSRYRR